MNRMPRTAARWRLATQVHGALSFLILFMA